MKITRFDIENFKGIVSTSIHLDQESVPGNVGTLIGLNESGKTTILEAISHFVTEDKDTANLVGRVWQKAKVQDLIPKDKKSAFTGRISVQAHVTIEDADIHALTEMYAKEGFKIKPSSVNRKITVNKIWEFEDSRLRNSTTLWSIRFSLARKTKFIEYRGVDSAPQENKEIWSKGIQLLRSRLPVIVYFPTFLFDFPDRIYLEGESDEINSYYVQVIQDVLDSQGEGLSVSKHIVERIERMRGEHSVPASFIAFFFGTDERKQVDAVLQKASNEMSKIIFGAWNEILGRGLQGKRVQIEWLMDAERDNAAYLELSIVDGQSKFALSERSLGFRWFFSFLLFTQFRQNRKNGISPIFLFDEPAANLHSKAQIKLIESFSKISKGSAYILYSTHSHYMINPLWLENAYIVRNGAVDYDDAEMVDAFSANGTDIKAIPYRTFVANHANKITYFQPVLDALDVVFSPLVRSSRALIVEGKNDYFPLQYFLSLPDSSDASIFPGNGAGSMASLISLFRGWGVDFCILLDGDKAGHQGKQKYIKDYFLRDEEVVTLDQIDETLKDCAFEGFYQTDVIDAVKAYFGVSRLGKHHFSMFFQALLAQTERVSLPNTEAAIAPLLEWVRGRLL